MEVTVVGSGTVVPRLGRRQSCVVVEAGGETLVFDLGSGAVRGMVRSGLDPFAVDRIFFTHFHPDHTVDAVNLLFTIKYGAEEERTRPLHLAGPEPFRRFWKSVLAVWGETMSGEYPTHVSELPRKGTAPLDLPGCKLSWAPTEHSPESIAYRLDGPEGAFVYTGDTEYSKSVVGLARGAHTLLIECTGPDDEPLPHHLTPSGAARVAREADVDRVVLTHLHPSVDDDSLASKVREGYGGEVVVAEDGLRLRV
ncbi:MAG: MBL fold metallo-hydrolase [Actinomycetota bacterium]|nr:MBL fold metallo-hydrolase [Actinomycetota bacterium]MDQ3430560.1 MBL fold metallo-hydrolase [Actinomycetota bacterium]